MYYIDISKEITCSMFGRMKQTNGWENPGEKKIESNLFVFVTGGNATFRISEEKYNVSQGDIIIIPSNTPYSPTTASYCEYYFFHFTGEIKETHNVPIPEKILHNDTFNLEKYKDSNIYFELKISDNTAYEKIYSEIINCTEYQSAETRIGRLMIDCQFRKILLTLGNVYENTFSDLPHHISKMIVYINKNIAGRINPEQMYRECNVSRSYASRLFRKYLDTTVTGYINNKKLIYACSLIKNTSMNISEISDYLGYCDVFYFSRLFKEKFGMPPSKY